MATVAMRDRDMLEVWLPLLTFAVLGWSWYHVLRLRERVIVHARGLCDQRGLQLLDDSVSLHRLRVGWRRGALHVRREYRFDTSLGGNDRQMATITMLGGRVVGASLPAAERFEAAPSAPATRHRPPPQPAATSNVVPIARIRRTLH